MRGIISRYKKSSHKLLKKFGATLENAAAEMFTFVMYPYVNSTTSLGEQSIRKLIGHRIQLKSDSGADRLCAILSCTETWKLHNLGVWDELRKTISPAAVSAS